MIRNQTFAQLTHHVPDFRGSLLDKNRNGKQNEGVSASHLVEIDQGKIKIRIPIQNILFVKAEHVYSRIFFSNDQQILQRVSLEKFLQRLPKHKFMRVHRSYLVNVEHIVKFNNTRILIGETVIPIGRSWRDKVVQRLRFLSSKKD